MPHDEYPHDVVFQVFTKVSDGAGGSTKSWKNTLYIKGFLDTPSSREIFQAMQLHAPLDRNLYFPYRNDVNETMRCTCEGDQYELIGKPQDQGGQHEIMKVPLKLVSNGS